MTERPKYINTIGAGEDLIDFYFMKGNVKKLYVTKNDIYHSHGHRLYRDLGIFTRSFENGLLFYSGFYCLETKRFLNFKAYHRDVDRKKCGIKYDFIHSTESKYVTGMSSVAMIVYDIQNFKLYLEYVIPINDRETKYEFKIWDEEASIFGRDTVLEDGKKTGTIICKGPDNDVIERRYQTTGNHCVLLVSED